MTAAETTTAETTTASAADSFDYTVRGPDSTSQLLLCDLEPGERLVFQPRHLLGFSSAATIRRRFRIDRLSFLMRQYSYWYIEGPAEVLLYGLGGIEAQTVAGTHAVCGRHVVGWTSGLRLGLTARQGLRAQVAGFDDLGQWRFEGDGQLLLQGSQQPPPRSLPLQESRISPIEFLRIALGL